MNSEVRADTVLVILGLCLLLGIGYVEVYLSWCLSTNVFIWYGIASSVILMPFALRRKMRSVWKIYVVYVLILTVLYAVPWSRKKRFVRDLGAVRFGMVESDVDRIMGKYIRGTGWPSPPSFDGKSVTNMFIINKGNSDVYSIEEKQAKEMKLEDAIVFRYSTNQLHNADWGVVTFATGHVIRVKFYSD